MSTRKCNYCQSFPILVSIDHIFPLSKGGKSTRDNLTSSCDKCNSMKGNLTISEFREYLLVKKEILSKNIRRVQKLMWKDNRSYHAILESEKLPELHRIYYYLNTIIKSLDTNQYYGQ